MPAKYVAMRDKFMKEGMKPKAAKQKAAKIYNKQRKKGQNPLVSHHNTHRKGY